MEVLAPHSPVRSDLSFGTPAFAVNNQYAKWKLGQPYGYRDLKAGYNRWKVRGMSYHAGTDFAAAIALYRSAIHAKARGYSHFYTVSFKLTCTAPLVSGPDGFSVCQGLSEEADIVSIGFQQNEPPPVCEEKRRWSVNCKAFAVDDVLLRFGTALKITPAQHDLDFASAQQAFSQVKAQ